MNKDENQLPDEELVRQVQAGNQEAFIKLYLKYYERVRRICLSAIKNVNVVEDLIQDVFIAVSCGIPNFRCGNFSAWVYTIAINRVRTELRQIALTRNTFISPADLDDVQASNAADPVTISEYKELKQLLADALEELPELTRKCVVALYRGYSYSEIAKIYHLTKGQVEAHLRKGLRFLRNKFMRLR